MVQSARAELSFSEVPEGAESADGLLWKKDTGARYLHSPFLN